jgi:putative membrane protein
MMGYGGSEGFGWLMGGGMSLMMLLFWIGPIALVVWGVAALRRGQQPPPREETPLDILRRRYASGEISQEEFEQAGRTLA